MKPTVCKKHNIHICFNLRIAECAKKMFTYKPQLENILYVFYNKKYRLRSGFHPFVELTQVKAVEQKVLLCMYYMMFTMSLCSRFALLASSSFTTSTWPSLEAEISAVQQSYVQDKKPHGSLTKCSLFST